MVELLHEEREMIAPYYRNSTDSTIYSYLQGYMGRAFVDDKKYIRHTMILQGDFIFPSGEEAEFEEAIARQMIQELVKMPNIGDVLIIPQHHAWEEFLSRQLQCQMIKRYAFRKMKLDDFDVPKLEMIAQKLPEGFVYHRFDEKICELALSMNWSQDFCSNFKTIPYFMEHGIGIAILKENEFVCGASSYTSYDQGIEIEIATKESYRNQGLASCCGAKLILECIMEGKIPNWDAANQTSVSIAKKLGFIYLGEYNTYEMCVENIQ